jgi:hypothetical protein
MGIYSIWEFRFPARAAHEGLGVAEAIWNDMPGFDGYVGHELIRDLDDPGHLLVLSKWTTRQRADDSLVEYAGHPNARRAEQLVGEPRRRFVGEAVQHPA